MAKKRKHSLTFSQKLFFCIFTTSFLLLTLGLLLLYKLASDNVTAINNDMMVSTLSVTGENLEQLFDTVDESVEFAMLQENALASVWANFAEDPSAYSTVRHAMVTAVAANDALRDMTLLDSQGAQIRTFVLNRLPYNNYSECLAYYEQVPEKMERPGVSWYFLQEDLMIPDSYVFANVRRINPPATDSQKEVVLVVFLSEERISRVYRSMGVDSYIMTETGTIISAADNKRIGTSADPKILQRALDAGKHATFLLQDRSAFLYSVYLPTINAYLIVNAGNAALQAANRTMLFTAFMLIVGGFLLSAVWSIIVSKAATRPLRELKRTMEQAHDGNLAIRSTLDQGDEIGYLSTTFNRMMDNLDQYIRQLKAQQEQTRESDLRLLQAQINPHLLYNTLDSVLQLITSNHSTQAARALEELSQFFKLSLQKGDKIVTVEDEIHHVEAYLNLQNLCRMKEFRLQVTGDQSLRQAKILHMLLQPIVENAVLHGLEGSFSDGLLEIHLSRQGDVLELQVTDDGMGMDEAELEAVRRRMAAPSPDGSFALWNIAQRIHASYGEAYGVIIESEFGEYTRVTLRIPCQMPDQKEEERV